MAIADIGAYAHLSDIDIENLARELDAIRSDVEESLGERDAAYIRSTIKFQRALDVAARLLIAGTRSRAGWWLGTATLAFAKTSRTWKSARTWAGSWMDERPGDPWKPWEWEMVAVSSQWSYSHNYRHHMFSNIVGLDDDLGFGVLRVTRDQPWEPVHLLSRYETCCWRASSSGASAFTASIRTATGGSQTR